MPTIPLGDLLGDRDGLHMAAAIAAGARVLDTDDWDATLFRGAQ